MYNEDIDEKRSSMKTVSVAVGELISFLFSAGDLTAETFMNVSLLEGTRAHQKHQSLYGEDDLAELAISYRFETDQYDITLRGRIDGLLSTPTGVVIEEIKTTRQSVYDDTFKPRRDHEAQLSMYAYMFMKNNRLDRIDGMITYIQLGDEQKRRFTRTYLLYELESFFTDAMIDYLEWVAILTRHFEQKISSISTLAFPFPSYRRGQREMMAAVYQAMQDNDIQYAIAPTGIGKTMATLFASLKGLLTDTQKIFYLTAKTAGKAVALDALRLLHEKGLTIKVLELTAKDSICFLEKRECNPEVCPFAKGFFNRLKDATMEIFEQTTIMDRSTIETYARKHTICPFEFSLFVSYFTDVIISDYNYVFDPRAHLIRYFDEDGYEPFLLIDEAHNLVSRSRDMYTAVVTQSTLKTIRRLSNKLKPSLRTVIKKGLAIFDLYDEALKEQGFLAEHTPPEALIVALQTLNKKVETVLRENPKAPRRTEIVDAYFEILAFVRMAERFNNNYMTNTRREGDDISITLQCLDASPYLLETLSRKTYGSVLFSATLHPIYYYAEVLTQNKGETLKIQSPFNPENLEIAIMNNISIRYKDRKASIAAVVQTIITTIDAKSGNYIAFFPSYGYLMDVLSILQPQRSQDDIIVQRRHMSHGERDQMITMFKNNDGKSVLGMFVMGGMFAEGIDYIGDMLSGVIIVGLGLPMINEVNNQLKDYYEMTLSKGFDYAYLYPGINKVIQAVGRVIRTPEDKGVAVLIDDRFNESRIRALFPLEWTSIRKASSGKRLKEILDAFWKKQTG